MFVKIPLSLFLFRFAFTEIYISGIMVRVGARFKDIRIIKQEANTYAPQITLRHESANLNTAAGKTTGMEESLLTWSSQNSNKIPR